MTDYGLKVIEVKDNVVALEKVGNREYGVYNAGAEVNYLNYKTQGQSNSTVTIICNPPNDKVIIDPKVWLTTQFTIQLLNTSSLTPPANWINNYFGATDAIRAFPLLQITNTATVNINGYSVSSNLSEYLNTILRYNNNYSSLDSLYSMCPSMLDQYQAYSLMNQSARNALGTYGDISIQNPRASWAIDSVIYSNSGRIGGVNDLATIKFSTVEPLWVSPFWFNNYGLSQISTLTISLVFANLNRIWCQSAESPASPLTIQSVNVGVVQANFKYYTSKLSDKIPKVLQYNYNTVQTISTTFNPPAYGQSATVSLNATNLQGYPQRIYIVCRRATNNLNQYSTDTFAYISNIAIQWNNRSNLLASAQSSDLYQLSRDKGCHITMDQWGYAGFNNGALINDYYNNNNFSTYPAQLKTGMIGSPICISPSDLGQNDIEANGVLGNPQFAVTATIQNTVVSNTDISNNVQLQITAYIVYEGLFIINNQQCTSTITPLSQANVLQAEEQKSIVAQRPSEAVDINENALGGAANNFIEKVKPYINTGLDIAKIIAGKKSSYKALIKKKGGKIIGGSVIGGKAISRNSLKKNMEDLEYDDNY
jgi:hypothetical protein